MAYDLFEVFASTQVTSEEVLQAELLAERVLSAKFPTLDLREGSGLRDALVRPNATFLAMMRKALLQYDTDRYLSNMDDNTPEALVDSQLGNFFLRRKEGSSSEVVIRVRFGHDLPVDTVTIPFLPMTEAALQATVVAEDGASAPVEGFERAFAEWRDDGRGFSIFTVPFEGELDRMIAMQMAAILGQRNAA